MLTHQATDTQVRISFYGIADDRVRLGERGLNLLEVMEQCSLAVDIQRRAINLRQFRDGHILAEESVTAVFKVVHGAGVLTNETRKLLYIIQVIIPTPHISANHPVVLADPTTFSLNA